MVSKNFNRKNYLRNCLDWKKIPGLKAYSNGKFNTPIPYQDLLKILEKESFKMGKDGRWVKRKVIDGVVHAVIIYVGDPNKKYDYSIQVAHEEI